MFSPALRVYAVSVKVIKRAWILESSVLDFEEELWQYLKPPALRV